MTLTMTNEQRAAASAALHIHEDTNGHASAPARTVTLSSGITVGIRKVSPFVMDAINRAFPAPTPPMVVSDFGNGETREEPNPADPDYRAALQAHNMMLGQKIQRVMWRLGIVPTIDHAALAVLREVMTAEGVPATEPDDHMDYINLIAVGDKADIQLLISAITGMSQPTEDAIQQTIATFPGDVQGS